MAVLGEVTAGRFSDRYRGARYILILVHGTWAKDEPWTQEGSFFRRFFEKYDGVVFYRFRWSGRNSLRDRNIAGKRLARNARALGLKCPDVTMFIIAHSHGGNAAFLALKDAQLASRIGGVVCFNTPFIHGRSRNLGDQGAGGVIAAAVVAVLVLLSWTRGQEFSPWSWRNLEILFAVSCITVPLLKKGAEKSARVLEMLDLPAAQRVFLITRTGDEASVALKIVYAVGRAIAWVWVQLGDFQRKTYIKATIAFLIVWGLFMIVDRYWFPGTRLYLALLPFIAPVVLAPVLMAPLALLLLLTIALQAAMGTDMAWLTLHLELTAEDTPEGKFTFRRFGFKAFGPLELLHSSTYHDETVLKEVAAWLFGAGPDVASKPPRDNA
ncbi:MAG: hypothetical protein JWQ87_981 [Candidatus Sulfotelmatobacter sp.]|nr:hypothetical protein [Candidatus Sulfotelmatobacter sp.]